MIDVTFDFETTALCPNAAVLSMGAVMWQRNGVNTPFFCLPDGEINQWYVFSAHVDLRSMFLNGFTFDPKTADWWSQQDSAAKDAVLADDDYELPCLPIDKVICNFFQWIDDCMKELGETEVCLWSQGSDFDIAILRNICQKFGIVIPVPYTNFRDHRTFFLEGARTICDYSDTEFLPKKAYALVEPYQGNGALHDPVFDCKRSIYSSWQMNKHLQCLSKKENCN